VAFFYNIDDGLSIALTQNYVSSSNLSSNLSTVLRFLKQKKNQISGCRDRSEEAVQPEEFYDEFSQGLKTQRPDLWEDAYPISEQRWTCLAWNDNGLDVNNSDSAPSDDNNGDKGGAVSKNVVLDRVRSNQKRKYDVANTLNGMSILERAKSKLQMGRDHSSDDQEVTDVSRNNFSFSFLQ